MMIGSFLFQILLCLSGFPIDIDPFANTSFDGACKLADQEKKIVLVDFYTTWCGPCKMLDRTTWKDKDVRLWLSEKTVAIKLDAEKTRELSGKYKINAYPTILLLKPDGTEIDRLVGFREPKAFLSEATDALAGKDAVARAKEKLTDDKKYDPMERQRYGDSLVQKGMFSEALDEYIWCFNHGLENNPAYAGVRLSFLLARIVSLGKDYPAAQQFLRERTDSVEQELISLYPKGTAEIANLRQEAMDYTALCRCLNQKKRLLETYDLLKSRPRTVEVRKLLLRDLIDKLLAARRYQDICETGNGLETIEQSIQSYQFTQSQFKERKGGMGDPTAYMKERVRVDGGKYYEAAVGASNLAEASAIVERLLDFDPSLATFENLANHALRAKRKDEAEKLVERAAQRLPAEQLASLRELVSDEDSTGSSDGDGN